MSYTSSALYTCGPYGNFLSSDGSLYEELVAQCEWNMSWSPSSLPACAATSCQEVPFPPRATGLQFVPDAENSLAPASQFSQYNPSLPLVMAFPGADFCSGEAKMLVVGKIPLDGDEPPDLVFRGPGSEEAFHVRIHADLEYIERWGVASNVTLGQAGGEGDGTTIDRDEPFIVR